jgi:hypothetical protein
MSTHLTSEMDTQVNQMAATLILVAYVPRRWISQLGDDELATSVSRTTMMRHVLPGSQSSSSMAHEVAPGLEILDLCAVNTGT